MILRPAKRSTVYFLQAARCTRHGRHDAAQNGCERRMRERMMGEFLDDHEEAHALATGMGLGFAGVAAGELKALGIAVSIGVQALERKNRPDPAERQHLGNDVRREAHYFLFGLVVGGVLGAASRAVNGRQIVP